MPFFEWRGHIRHLTFLLSAPRRSSWRLRALRTRRSASAWIWHGRLSASGANVSSSDAWKGCRTNREAGGPRFFPPEVVVEVKALACQLPHELDLPLSRLSTRDIAREAVSRGIVASIGGATVWRWLSEDAIKPWQHRQWIFPRDPNFAVKAGQVLDLYQGLWEGKPLRSDEFVVSTDEKTSIQARDRCHASLPPGPGQPTRVEHEYKRRGAWAYLAGWDVRRAKIFGRCEPKTGIEPFHRLVDQVMQQEPYRSARRVFWVSDNGSSHRGEAAKKRLREWYPNAILVNTPTHASWLNQVEIYFSVVQRKVLTPNNFANLGVLADHLLRFERIYEEYAKPFEWKFTRAKLSKLLAKIEAKQAAQNTAA